MNEYTYTKGRFTFKRVSKTTARRCYNNGLPVIVCPVNLRPGSPWNCDTEFRPGGDIPVRTVDRFTGEAPTVDTLGTVEQYDYSYISQ